MFQNTIKKRVMTQINKRIEASQKQFDESCKQIDLDAEKAKTDLADKHVNDLLGKFV